MKTAAEKMRERLGKERVMTSISLRIPEKVIEDLKEIAPSLGYSGYQGLIKGYISQGLRRDLERLEGSDVQALTESLRQQGVADEVIASAIADARIVDGTFEMELKRFVDTKDRTGLCTFLESIPANHWKVTEGMAITSREWVDIIVLHVSGGSGINTYETVAINVKWSNGDVKYLGAFSSEELKLPNYIPVQVRQAMRERLTKSA
jgi:hypothetical protein